MCRICRFFALKRSSLINRFLLYLLSVSNDDINSKDSVTIADFMNVRVPECQKSKLLSYTSMALNALNSNTLEYLALKGLIRLGGDLPSVESCSCIREVFPLHISCVCLFVYKYE